MWRLWPPSCHTGIGYVHGASGKRRERVSMLVGGHFRELVRPPVPPHARTVGQGVLPWWFWRGCSRVRSTFTCRIEWLLLSC